MLRRLAGLAIMIVARGCLFATASPEVGLTLPAQAGELVSETSQPATAEDLSGKSVDLFKVAGDKPVVLIFVRTDCPISNRYAPTIQALGQKYSGTAILMLVYPDKSETPQSIEQHLHNYGYKIGAFRDPKHVLVALGKVAVTPEAAVFNSKRDLVYHGRIDNCTRSLVTPDRRRPHTSLTMQYRLR